MDNKKLLKMVDTFVVVLAKNKGEYGGKGKFELPKDHVAAMKVSPGGSSCATCEYVDADNHACKNEYYIQWNGGDSALPKDIKLQNLCSDWWEPKK